MNCPKMKGHSGLQSYSQAREAQEVQLNRLQQEEQAVEDEQAEQQQPAKRSANKCCCHEGLECWLPSLRNSLMCMIWLQEIGAGHDLHDHFMKCASGYAQLDVGWLLPTHSAIMLLCALSDCSGGKHAQRQYYCVCHAWVACMYSQV